MLAGRTRELGVAAGMDASYFDLGTETDVGALVPSARTLSFRLGADGRVRVAGRVSLLAGGAWLAPITRGESPIASGARASPASIRSSALGSP